MLEDLGVAFKGLFWIYTPQLFERAFNETEVKAHD